MILITVFVYIVSLIVIMSTLSVTKGFWKTLFGSLLIGILLTYLVLFEFNQRPIFLSEEANAIELLSGIEQHSLNVDSVMQNEELILIDVSAHTQLVESPVEVFDDSTAKQAVTDRDQLARFFNWIAKDSVNKYLGAVVCDILLENATPSDDSLRIAMAQLIKKDQLFFAKHDRMSENQLAGWFGTDTVAWSVDIVEYDGMYFSHGLRDANGSPSLPYALYLHHTNRLKNSDNLVYQSRAKLFPEVDPTSNSIKWVSNWLIPDLILKEEDINGVLASEPKTIFGILKKSLDDIFLGELSKKDSLVSYTLFPISLGAATQESGHQYLKNTLQAASTSGKHITIFLGSFSDERDMHETAFGPMHGGLIILNIYLNLISAQHWVNIYYVIFLVILFSVVAWGQINRIQISNKKKKCRSFNWLIKRFNLNFFKKKDPHLAYKILSIYIHEFVINPWHYWLLLGTLLVSMIYFHRVVNIMAVAIVLASVDFAIRAVNQALNPDLLNKYNKRDFVKTDKNGTDKKTQQ